jgi:mono/diheme cytochrome c family protein
VSDNDVILGLVALVLVVFSLVVSMLIPRRDPGFPGRNLRIFVVVAVLLVVAMLAAVEVLGGEHEEGGGEEAAATETETGGGETGGGETGAGAGAEGDPAAGKAVFEEQNCAQCHTLADAGAAGTLGPNLDEALAGQDAASVEQSILDPDAEISEGFPDNLMPEDYGEKLDDKQVGDLVAYLLDATQG